KDHLIILPCHAIWKFYAPFSNNNPGEDIDEWELASFQKPSKDHLILIKHLQKTIEILNTDIAKSTLIISGGQTKKQCGPISEALSYYLLGCNLKIVDEKNSDSIFLEEFARDSFENLVFAISRFKQIYNSYPKKITIVGYEFKKSRFLDYHVKAIKFPVTNVEYVGIDPQLDDSTPENEKEKFQKDLKENEYAFALKFFMSDEFGIKAPLAVKKEQRDPFKNGNPY
ncbi:hypothetical protein PACTADRAFT_19239, partial [Pachysolen tannophilus NRRL Y-2460]